MAKVEVDVDKLVANLAASRDAFMIQRRTEEAPSTQVALLTAHYVIGALTEALARATSPSREGRFRRGHFDVERNRYTVVDNNGHVVATFGDQALVDLFLDAANH